MDVADQPESQGFPLACARLTPPPKRLGGVVRSQRVSNSLRPAHAHGDMRTPHSWLTGNPGMAPGDYLFKKSCPPDAKGFGESGFPWAGAQGLLLESADSSTRSDRNNSPRPRFARAPLPRGEFYPPDVSWFWGERPSRGWRGSPGETPPTRLPYRAA